MARVSSCPTNMVGSFIDLNYFYHRSGIYRYSNGDVYEGKFKHNKAHGFGIYKSIEGDIYEGEYKDDKRHGKGKLRSAMGGTFSGTWTYGVKDNRTSNCHIS